MENTSVPAAGVRLGKAQFQLLLVGMTALAIGAVFLGLVWDYLIALFLAAIFSAMASPIYRWIHEHVGKRQKIAVALTLLALSTGVLLPLIAVIVLGAQQAVSVAADVTLWAETLDLKAIEASLPAWIPFKLDFAALSARIAAKISEAAGEIANLFVSVLSQATRGTVRFFLDLFIMVYAMIFFLPQRSNMFRQMLAHSGLPQGVQKTLGDRVISISRATIKGTFLIGVAQGFLGGLGFWATGLPGAAFWGCVMAVLSVIPGIGPTLVLVPGVIVLAVNEQYLAAAGLAAWTALAVTTVDNILRPVLVGRDTQMPDLLVLVSTFGGLAIFGAVGLIIGPVIAGLFITIWSVLEDYLRADGLTDTPYLDEGQQEPAPTEAENRSDKKAHDEIRTAREGPETVKTNA
ncbi:AI-2E family transporter [Stappia sp. GBMRC 2046]|uniref:AI-2E family transporter n=1 Tax=Stappia sediminis TaxID=2692190 RepID=A0A7X3LR84_9HYPH|nr:AI-2E family transporter [Stappia sediminis]MXN63619.1 AI-2E family transporter [Stappia sediminis]